MSYNLRIYVVDPYNHKEIPQTGRVMAMVELGSIPASGSLYKLVENSQSPKIPFAIRVEKPDGGHALMRWLQEYIDCGEFIEEDEKAKLTQLNLDYEESLITTDRYGDVLGVCDVPDFLEALNEDLETNPNSEMQLAKVLLEEIRLTTPYGGRFVNIITYGH